MGERHKWSAVVLVVFGALAGCSESGPKAFRISGTVALDGQPIPCGEVIFTPDAAQKNSGPQGIAEIHEGKYDTAAMGGKGVAGGPTVIRVNGMSGPRGKTLCEYELKMDLPRQDSIQNISVPKQPPPKPAPEI